MSFLRFRLARMHGIVGIESCMPQDSSCMTLNAFKLAKTLTMTLKRKKHTHTSIKNLQAGSCGQAGVTERLGAALMIANDNNS